MANEFLSGELGINTDVMREYSLLDKIGRSIKNESLTYQMKQKFDDFVSDRFTDDPAFDDSSKKQMYKEFSGEIHPRFEKYLMENSNSAAEFESNLKYLEEETFKQNELESMGIGEIAINIGSNLIDIPLLLATRGAVLRASPKIVSGTMNSLPKRALVGGGIEVGLEAIKDFASEYDRTAVDYALGFTFGAGVSAVFKDNPLIADASRRTINKTLQIDELNKKTANAVTDEEKETIVKDHMQNLNLQEDVSFQTAKKNLEDEKIAKFDNGAFDKLRVDLAYLTAKSNSKTMQDLADNLFIDGTLQSNQANRITGAEIAGMIEDRIIDSYSQDSYKIALDFGKLAFGQGVIKTRLGNISQEISNIAGEAQMMKNLYGSSREEAIEYINSRLLKLMDQRSLSDEAILGQIQAISKRIDKTSSKAFTNAHDVLSKQGKAGFADGVIPKTEQYMPIIYNRNMAAILQSKGLNYGHFSNFIESSFLNKIKIDGIELSEDQLAAAKAAAKGVASKIWKNKDSINYSNQSYDDVFRQELRSEGLSEEFIDAITKVADETPIAKATKKRSMLDYSTKMTFNNGSKDIELSFMDLVEKDLTGVVTQYARKMGGTTALEKIKFKKQTKDLTGMKKLSSKLREAFKTGNAEKISKAYKNIEEAFPETAQRVEELTNMIADLYKKVAAQTHKQTAKAMKDAGLGEFKAGDEEYDQLFEKYFRENIEQLDLEKINKELEELSTKDVEIDLGTAKNINTARGWIEQELVEAGATPSQRQSDLARFDNIVKELQGMPTAEDPFSTLSQAQRIMKNVNIARLLGQTGWTMSAELGSTVVESGLRNFMEFSSFKTMFRQFRTGEIDDTLAQEIQTYTGLGNTLNRAIGVNKYEHEYTLSDLGTSASKREAMLAGLENLSEKATEATLLFGGVKPLTAAFESVLAKSMVHQILDIAKKGGKISKSDKKLLNELGFDEEYTRRIFDQISKHGKLEPRKWSNGHKVQSMGMDKWDDQEAQDFLINGLRRRAHTIVQRSNMGDKVGVAIGDSLMKNTIYGRFFLELKDYLITSYVKQLGRVIKRGDVHAVALIAAQSSALMLATAMQNYTNFAGNEEKLKKSFEPDNFARTVLGRMPAASYIPTIVDNSLRLTTGDTVFSSNRYHSGVQDAFMSMPSVDLLQKAGSVFSLPYKATFGDGIGSTELNDVVGLLPLGNTYGIRTLKEYVGSELDD